MVVSNIFYFLVVKSLGPLHLHGFQPGPFPSAVRDVMPRDMQIPDDELRQVVIGEDEHRKLLRFCDPMIMLLPRLGKCPTALHSWGSQVLPCPCGCRPVGFSDEVLASRGVCGVFLTLDQMVCLDGHEYKQLRHLHPSELAVLTGTPIPPQWPQSLKLTLCRLGQQAAPFQSVWIAGQLHRHLDEYFGTTPVFDYDSCLWNLMTLVIDQAKALFQVDPSTFGSDDTAGGDFGEDFQFD